MRQLQLYSITTLEERRNAQAVVVETPHVLVNMLAGCQADGVTAGSHLWQLCDVGHE
jgi:hypothetical protein